MSLLPYFYDMERPFRLMDRPFFNSDFGFPFSMMPYDFFKPWNFKPMEQLISAMNQMDINPGAKITADDQKFQVIVDVQHFAPNEISVKVANGEVLIEGKHEERKDQHGYVSRQFVRKYTLPEGCLADTVNSSLSSDGILTVTAPKALALPSTGEKIIPITHTGPVQKITSGSD